MALAKVAAIVYARKLINSEDTTALNRFLKLLSPEEAECFTNLLSTDKLPIEKVTRFLECAATWLFPDKSFDQSLWQLGYQNAQNDMKGIYKICLRIATVEMVIKNAALIWKNYHDKGQVSVQKQGVKHILFIVAKYSDIPKSFRILLNGYITGLLDLTGAKNIKVTRNDADPNAWVWVITFD